MWTEADPQPPATGGVGAAVLALMPHAVSLPESQSGNKQKLVVQDYTNAGIIVDNTDRASGIFAAGVLGFKGEPRTPHFLIAGPSDLSTTPDIGFVAANYSVVPVETFGDIAITWGGDGTPETAQQSTRIPRFPSGCGSPLQTRIAFDAGGKPGTTTNCIITVQGNDGEGTILTAQKIVRVHVAHRSRGQNQ
jgi:hypothetical protein